MVDPLTALLVAAAVAALTVFLFWPERGLYFRWQKARRMTERVLIEDALKHIHKCEFENRRPTLESIAGVSQLSLDQASELVSKLQERQLLTIDADGCYHLTASGRDYALHVLRTHRLWERYLAEKTGYSEADWHELAEVHEHVLSPSETAQLSASLGNPTHDPHGDPIPTAEGKIFDHGGRPLPSFGTDQPLLVVHLEDEPPTIYAQLVAEGLHPGQVVRIVENSPSRIRFWADGDEHVLAPILAANVSAVPAAREASEPPAGQLHLSDLEPGQRARVETVSPHCRGLERRRFMDLGILPGTMIEVEMRSPSGDPTAYRIRGAAIALRREQAANINVTILDEAA